MALGLLALMRDYSALFSPSMQPIYTIINENSIEMALGLLALTRDYFALLHYQCHLFTLSTHLCI